MIALIFKLTRSTWAVKLPVLLLLFFLSFVAVAPANSQEARSISIKGTVASQAGEPLAGVTVFIKGSTKAVITQPDGSFQVEAPAGSTLIVTYIGFISKEIKNGQR